MIEKLSANFLNEFFKSVLKNRTIFDIAYQHIEYHYLPTQPYKEIWKAITTHYKLYNSPPTIGILSQQFKDNADVLVQLSNIKDSEIPDKQSILYQLETFLKRTMFVSLHGKVKELYEDGQQDKAYELLEKESGIITNFSLRAKTFDSIFKQFSKRYDDRVIANINDSHKSNEKCSWGIDPLDNRHYGGVDKGDTALVTARSNVGKSPFLKHVAYTNAKQGKNVLHIQLEGSKKECQDSYDAMLSGNPLQDVEMASLPNDILEQIVANVKKVRGDIYVVAYEKFGIVTMRDIRNDIIEYLKVYDNLDMLVLDYIDKADPGNGKKYNTGTDGEKARRAANADLFKNICVEFNISGFTGTQTGDITPEVWNDPKKVITRSNIKGDKNFIDPFSYHVTLNQTKDEKANEIMRLYEDKCRKYGYGHLHYICTAYKHSRFYDRRRTINQFKK